MPLTHEFVERPVFYVKAIEIILLLTSLGCILAVERWSLSGGAIAAFTTTLVTIIANFGLLVMVICEQWHSFSRVQFTTVNKYSSLILSVSLLITTQFFSADFSCGTVQCITAQVAAAFLNCTAVVLFIEAFRYFYQFNVEDKNVDGIKKDN